MAVTPGKRTAIVAGATGLIGRELVKQLLETSAYERVVVLVRRQLDFSHPKMLELIVNFEHLSLPKELRADDVFCCLGTTIKKAKTREAFRLVDLEYPLMLAREARKTGASQYLVVSAMGASEGSAFFYSRVKGELEQRLQKTDIGRLRIFRPSLLLGDRIEKRTGEQAAIKLVPVFGFLFKGPLKKYIPIEAQDVAAAMVQTALNGDSSQVAIYHSHHIKELSSDSR